MNLRHTLTLNLRRGRSVLIQLFTLGLIGASSAISQQPQPSGFESFRIDTVQYRNVVADWEHRADLQIALLICVIVFGALITLFQALNRGWSKNATLVLGAAVSVLTAVTSQVFPVDHKALLRAVERGNHLILKMEDFNKRLSLPSATKENVSNEFIDLTTRFEAIDDDGILGGAPENPGQTTDKHQIGSQSKSFDDKLGPFPDAPTVYASTQQPSCMAVNPVYSEDSIIFDGVGSDASLAVAQRESLDSAVATGVNAVAYGKDIDRDFLARVISSSAIKEPAYYDFHPETQTYCYHTVLRVTSKILKTSFPPSPNPSSTKSVAVHAKHPWTDAKIEVREGEKLSITASGQIRWADGSKNFCGPEGVPHKPSEDSKNPFRARPIKDGNVGALIAKIGSSLALVDHESGTVIKVGTSSTFTADRSGTLFLGINDDDFTDNDGHFTVIVSKSP